MHKLITILLIIDMISMLTQHLRRKHPYSLWWRQAGFKPAMNKKPCSQTIWLATPIANFSSAKLVSDMLASLGVAG